LSLPQNASGIYSVVVGGYSSSAGGYRSVAIGGSVLINGEHAYAVTVSAGAAQCVSSGASSFTLCAAKNVSVTGERFIVNGVDILAELQDLKAALKQCAGSGRRLDTGCVGAKGTASGVVVGTLLALGLTAAALF
jgi:hypothetical protein